MLRSPLQGLKNKHVESSLQQLNPVLILVSFAHRCRHSTPMEVDCLPHSVKRRKQPCPLSRFKSKFVLRTTIGDSTLARIAEALIERSDWDSGFRMCDRLLANYHLNNGLLAASWRKHKFGLLRSANDVCWITQALSFSTGWQMSSQSPF